MALISFAHAQQIESQIDQSRQFNVSSAVRGSGINGTQMSLGDGEIKYASETDMGCQQILKQQEKTRPFTIFANVTGNYTNNIALVTRGAEGDYLLNSSAGASFQPKLTDNLQGEFTIRFSIFRYNKFGQLDFDSLDAGGGLSYQLTRLWDSVAFVRYNFTDLFTGREGDSFFQDHTIIAGVQKTFVLGRAHYLAAGCSAQAGFSDPSDAQRNEYGVYVGYHLDVTRNLAADLFYRAAWCQYTEINRDDTNHTFSGSLTYKINDLACISGDVSFALNRSDRPAFNYNVLNTGMGLTVGIKF